MGYQVSARRDAQTTRTNKHTSHRSARRVRWGTEVENTGKGDGNYNHSRNGLCKEDRTVRIRCAMAASSGHPPLWSRRYARRRQKMENSISTLPQWPSSHSILRRSRILPGSELESDGRRKAEEDVTRSSINCTSSFVYYCPGLTQIDNRCLLLTCFAHD